MPGLIDPGSISEGGVNGASTGSSFFSAGTASGVAEGEDDDDGRIHIHKVRECVGVSRGGGGGGRRWTRWRYLSLRTNDACYLECFSLHALGRGEPLDFCQSLEVLRSLVQILIRNNTNAKYNIFNLLRVGGFSFIQTSCPLRFRLLNFLLNEN